MATDFTTVMGRILSDPSFREQFFADRDQVLAELCVDDGTAHALRAIQESAVRKQANGLIGKRYREALKLLPQTMQQLGNRGRELFDEYATSFWPSTHRRHLIDAARFCRFLQQSSDSRYVSRAELNTLDFELGSQRVALCFLRDHIVGQKRHFAVQLQFRLRDGGEPHTFLWYLRFPAFSV